MGRMKLATGVIEDWRDARLVCGIGHIYAGRVRVVTDTSYDMDGDPIQQPPRDDYEPDCCIVCGLRTWKRG